MRERMSVNSFLISMLLVLITVLLSGCLFSSSDPLVSLQIAAPDTVVAGGSVVLTAVGKTEGGRTIFVENPDWSITQGNGALQPDGNVATFYAIDWEYDGEVTIKATVGDIESDSVTITVLPLLQGSPDIFPKPTSPMDPLPSKTESFVVVGEPIDDYRFLRTYGYDVREGNFLITRWEDKDTTYVQNGKLTDPYKVAGGPIEGYHNYSYATPGALPEAPHLSVRIHYELVERSELEFPSRYSDTVSYTQGTTKVDATEFTWSTAAEVKAKSNWGWSEVTATLKATLESKTTTSLTVMEEKTVTKERTCDSIRGYVILWSVWNRVETFYISDSQGIPVNESPVFEGYMLPPLEVAFMGTGIRQKVWAFEE